MAQNKCGWLSEGTAAHLLGGDVAVAAQQTEEGEGTCSFHRQQGAVAYTLDVSVQRKADNACAHANSKGLTNLSGIGNEAVLCSLHPSAEEFVDAVAGRVRELNFTVSLSTRGLPKTAMPLDARRSVVSQVAEQVAGALF